MAGQRGFFDVDDRLCWLNEAGDPLARRAAVVDFEVFREELERALLRSDRAKGGRPPYDAVLMFRLLVLQTLHTLSDEQAEYQVRDRLSFMHFVGLGLGDPMPDVNTLWDLREARIKAGENAADIWPDQPAKVRRKDTEARWTVKVTKVQSAAAATEILTVPPDTPRHRDPAVRLQEPHLDRPSAPHHPKSEGHRCGSA